MDRIKEILARKKEINEIMQDEKRSKEANFKEIEKEVRELNEELEGLEAEERLRSSMKGDGTDDPEKRNGEGRFHIPGQASIDPPKNEERDAFDSYLETRDITTDGLKTDEGYVVVPVEESKTIIDLAEDILSLKQYVTVKPVSTASGKQPVRTTARTRLQTVEELNESPAVGVTPFTEVKFDISTKRGYVPYSKEYQEDGINLVADLKQFMSEVVINTENHDILTELGTIRAQTIESLDGLKTLINTGFPVGKGNRVKLTMGQTPFDVLDQLKDKQGHYLLQSSISSPTGKKLFGRDILVLDDVDLPSKDTMYVGDLKEIVYFDRSKMSVQWTSYLHFGECLAVALRNDVGKVEDEKTKVGIYKIKFTPPEELPEVEG